MPDKTYEEFEGTRQECEQWWRDRGATDFHTHHQRDMSEVRAYKTIHSEEDHTEGCTSRCKNQSLGMIKVYWRSGGAKTHRYF
jgi:hypothetical protein